MKYECGLGVDGGGGKWYGIEKAGVEMKIHTLSRCGIFAAALAICAWISVPLGDQAISLQTFGVFLALGLLGGFACLAASVSEDMTLYLGGALWMLTSLCPPAKAEEKE